MRMKSAITIWFFKLLFAISAATLMADEDLDDVASPEQTTDALVIEGMVTNESGGGVKDALVRIESLDAPEDAAPLAESKTNQFGDISMPLPKTTRGPVRVRVVKAGYAPHVAEVTVGIEEEPVFLDILLTGVAKLTGRVTSVASSQPVADATVECDSIVRTLTTKTDSDGRYLFENLSRGQMLLNVKADGFGLERHRVAVGDEETIEDVELRPEWPVELIIEDNERRPAPEVNIEAMIVPLNHYLTTTTDGDGRAELHGVNQNAKTILLRMNGTRYVRMREYAKIVRLPETETQPTLPSKITRRFVVRTAAGAKGQVTDSSGEPVIGVRVVVGRELTPDMPMTWTDEEGRYFLANLDPGFNVVSYQHADYATAIREVRLPNEDAATVDLSLEAGLAIGGVVVDETDQPMDAVTVNGASWKGFETLGMRMLAGDDGTFHFTNAPAGEIEFTFVKPGYGPVVTQTLTAGKTDYHIVLKAFDKEQAPARGEEESTLAIGETVPELTMTATDGTVYKLSELRGKYVFIDCWASWCGPCVGEIPNVKALHQATKERADFVLLSVSLDTDAKAFQAAVKKHEMNWPQVYGPKSGARETFEVLEGTAIPYTCLIGPDGKLLAQHLRGPGMVDEVKELLAAPTKPPDEDEN